MEKHNLKSFLRDPRTTHVYGVTEEYQSTKFCMLDSDYHLVPDKFSGVNPNRFNIGSTIKYTYDCYELNELLRRATQWHIGETTYVGVINIDKTCGDSLEISEIIPFSEINKVLFDDGTSAYTTMLENYNIAVKLTTLLNSPETFDSEYGFSIENISMIFDHIKYLSTMSSYEIIMKIHSLGCNLINYTSDIINIISAIFNDSRRDINCVEMIKELEGMIGEYEFENNIEDISNAIATHKIDSARYDALKYVAESYQSSLLRIIKGIMSNHEYYDCGKELISGIINGDISVKFDFKDIIKVYIKSIAVRQSVRYYYDYDNDIKKNTNEQKYELLVAFRNNFDSSFYDKVVIKSCITNRAFTELYLYITKNDVKFNYSKYYYKLFTSMSYLPPSTLQYYYEGMNDVKTQSLISREKQIFDYYLDVNHDSRSLNPGEETVLTTIRRTSEYKVLKLFTERVPKSTISHSLTLDTCLEQDNIVGICLIHDLVDAGYLKLSGYVNSCLLLSVMSRGTLIAYLTCFKTNEQGLNQAISRIKAKKAADSKFAVAKVILGNTKGTNRGGKNQYEHRPGYCKIGKKGFITIPFLYSYGKKELVRHIKQLTRMIHEYVDVFNKYEFTHNVYDINPYDRFIAYNDINPNMSRTKNTECENNSEDKSNNKYIMSINEFLEKFDSMSGELKSSDNMIYEFNRRMYPIAFNYDNNGELDVNDDDEDDYDE